VCVCVCVIQFVFHDSVHLPKGRPTPYILCVMEHYCMINTRKLGSYSCQYESLLHMIILMVFSLILT
jgi:hypothetical protein